uniref:WGS project CBMG000000000 data, contig CS5907-c003343 n=1 Tax=Fusarium acuminatum CS5907 TaxID=1318461 RepID=A0A090ME23_9HYPO|nr:unnamed protein product [Fusarium acuminatum CS5907]
MQLINLCTLAIFTASAFAADCSGDSNDIINEFNFKEAYWSARELMCSNSGCTYQEACTTSAKRTATLNFTKVSVAVEIKRKNTGGKKGYKDCWDATEEIINQCISGQSKMSGTWEYNGQLYQVNGYFTK